MKIYNYHPATFEFRCESDARESPREPGNYLIPANATTVATTPADPGFARQFDPQTDTWATVEDHRGEVVYRKSDAQKIVVDWLGDIGPDYTDQAPSSANDTWDGSQWVPPQPTSADVDAERDMRQYPGALPTGLGWDVDLRNEQDRRNIQAKYSIALKRKINNDNSTILFRGADNVDRNLTPDQMIAVGDAADAWITSVYAASWVLKETAGGIPADYADDSRWPSVP